MATLAALAAQQRASRARLEADAAARLVTAYGRAWDAISRDLAALTRAIEAAQARGETVNTAWLARQSRYRALMDQVETQIDGLAQQAGPLVRAQQAKAIASSANHAEALARAAFGPPPPGVAVTWDRVPVEATRELIGALGDGRPLGELLATFGPEARAAADEALTTALVRGSSPRLAAQALEAAVQGLGRNRALRLARSSMLDAYRDSTLAAYRQNDVITAYKRIAAHGPRTCLACLALDGKIYPLGQDFSRHASCRCALVPVTKSWSDLGYPGIPEPAQPETGAAWFARQPKTTQRAMLGSAFPYYERGQVTLNDFVEEINHPRWGANVRQRPLRDVLAGIDAVAADAAD